MLREEIEQYTNLTGEDGWHVPIMKVGAYLDGYNKGLEVLDEIRAEIDRQEKWLMCAGYNAYNVDIAFNSIKSVLSESEVKKNEEENNSDDICIGAVCKYVRMQ